MTDLELAVRTIQEMTPTLPTAQLQKWKSILTTALLRIEEELQAVHEHTCHICFYKEFGYRDELPIAWHEVKDVIACFQHEYDDVKLFIQEGSKEPTPQSTEQTVEELMDLL